LKTALKILTGLLLLLNSAGAFFGGWNLVRYPDGSSLQLSTEWLQHSPFSDYFIPGLVLLAVNGLFGLFVLLMLVVGNRRYPAYVIIQGVLLGGWILVQVIMVRTVVGLHFLFGGIAMLLLLLGWILLDMARKNDAGSKGLAS
jgi:hypothetical protein